MEDLWLSVCCRGGVPVCEHGFCIDHRDQCDQCEGEALKAELNEIAERLKADIRARSRHININVAIVQALQDVCDGVYGDE